MTSLQKQLAAIAASSTHQLDLKAQKTAHGKSLLFEPRVAASQSFDNIYFICYEGYRDLCALDSRFAQFQRSLFSEQSKVEDRTQMTKKENEKLDIVLEAFITLVGPRLLLKPAEKALEWLVRRFRVHEYNTECLVLTYLPYHNTPQFLALLSILPSNPPPALRFLFPYIQSPTNPPRQTIAYTAVNTPAFFNALQTYVVKVLDAGHQGSALLSFWSSVTTQAIDGILNQSNTGRKEIQDQRTEEVLLRVLPVLNNCMKLSSGSDAITACYMIIIVLVTKTAFEDKVLDSLMEAAILSQDSETLDACLMCLAIVAEERSQVQLPAAVIKRLLRISKLRQILESLSKRCRVERLALGCALGALEYIDTGVSSDEKRETFKQIIASDLLNDSHITVALAALIQVLQNSSRGSDQYNQLHDLVANLNELTAISKILQTIAKDRGVELESLGLVIQQRVDTDGDVDIDSEDEDMLDVEENSNKPPVHPPEITTTSFLDRDSSESFSETVVAFEQAVASNQTSQFLDANCLRRQEATKAPLFLSFLIRVWCSSSPMSVRVAAIRATTAVVKELDSKLDLQILIPYLIHALADPSPLVRRTAAACTAAIAEKTETTKQGPKEDIWGAPNIYGKNSSKIAKLQGDQTSTLLASILLPILEECVMDSKLVISAIKEILEGSLASKNQPKQSLKSAARVSILTFLASHATITPLIRVRLRLFPIFNFLGKISNSIRTNSLLPAIRTWCSLSVADVALQCSQEKVDIIEADRGHLAALMPRESESAHLVNDIIHGNVNKERLELIETTFDRLNFLWTSLKSDARLLLSQTLLDLSLKDDENTFNRICREQALETLRNVKLDTAALLSFVESIPPALQMPEGPPAKKRRRTSRTEMARAELQSPDDVTRLLRRLTLVLELIESSKPEQHPALFKNLFATLGELQQLKQQASSELVYLQSLILGSLTPIVKTFKDQQDTSEYQSAVRADLLIDCIRHSTSPQVQNSALLLIASLASWVPELILHNLMPIFTFVGATLLRQQDDYSAHVVDQTISRVVPPLAASLRAKNRNFLTGVADLLLSFTAAFEHIPSHRRLKLFSELARTLGPRDSLPAIIALLVDRYPNSKTQRRFTTDLLLAFEPMLTLETFKGYLDLVADAAGPKRKISDTLFSLNEKQASQVESALSNLLSSLADLAADERLQTHVPRAFRRRNEPTRPREIFASIAETTIQLSKKVSGQPKVYTCCSRVLAKCLDLLPTGELIKSAELLLANTDHQVQVAAIRSVEVRAGSVVQNDQTSVSALLSFLPKIEGALQKSQVMDVKSVAVSCIDRIVERFGKKDTSTVASVAQIVSGPDALSSNDNRVRILSLLCLTSMVDVLEDEAIALLPTILPKAFEYLETAIEQENTGLHNAVYTLLSNVVERLGYMFSREYMIPTLRLSQRSAAGDLDEACNESRTQFYESVSNHLEAQEAFAAIKATWSDALNHGFEASYEQLNLIHSTIESQTKSRLIKASPTLFGLFIDVFKLRDTIDESNNESLDDDEIEQLEGSLIETVIAMVLKLNDATFRPFFVQLVESANSTSKSDMSRLITLYKFLAAFFDKFKSIVTSYSSYIIEYASKLLELLSKGKGESELRSTLLNALQSTFEHDQDGFWQSPSHYGAIMTPLLEQLTIDSPDEVTSNVIPAITELAAASASSIDNHREMNTVLLKYMRAEEAYTRLATVKCEQSLTKKLGEEWLGLLPEMLPFISELREDDDEMVERETQRWITMVEEILGEDLDAMLQ